MPESAEIPTLPDDDANPSKRNEALERARDTWQYDPHALPPLASTRGVPAPAKPSMPWYAKVAKRAALVASNEIAVRLTWGRDVDADVALERFDPQLAKVAEKQAEHEAFAKRFAHWHDEGGLESIGAPPSPEEQEALVREVEARLEEVTGPGIQPASAELEGIREVLLGARGRPAGVDDYARLFKAIPLPNIASTWQEDVDFAWHQLAGPNARVLRGIDRIPDNIAVTNLHFRAAMGDADSLEAAAQEGRLFLADYAVVGEVLQPAAYGSEQKYLSAPLALFAVPKDGGRLRPVAIQCAQSPDEETNPVLTPSEVGRWKLAKAMVQAADGNHHELISHLGRTHLYIEPVLLATHRTLAPNHPVNRLLVPHFEGTVFINDSARRKLIADGGAVDRIFAGTIESARALAVRGVESYDFSRGLLPKVLQSAATDAIRIFPYRDDARLHWDAIRAWVESYVHHYYADDAIVTADTELRAWAAQLAQPVSAGGAPGFPPVETRADLIEVLSHFIFVPSCEHAAVNFPQRTDMAYAPALSGAGWRRPPHGSDEIDDAERLAFMPPLELAREQLDLLNIIGAVHHTKLGDYRSNRFPYADHFRDPAVTTTLLPAFQNHLREIETTIAERNQHPTQRLHPYPHLLPSRVPMSINI